MPWHSEAMKDVGGCDKPGGGANQPVIPGCPNGKTQYPSWVTLMTEYYPFGEANQVN